MAERAARRAKPFCHTDAEMNSLLKMLPLMLRLAGENDEVKEQAVFAAWRAAAGPQIVYNCPPFRLYQRHLVICVADQTWKKQMEQLSGQYLFRINSLLSKALVTFIEFRIDPDYVKEARPVGADPHEFTHTAQLESELQAAAARIKDEALRAQFLHAAAKCLERNGA